MQGNAKPEDVGSTKDAGRVTVLYSTPDGVRRSGNLIADRGTKGVAGSVDKGGGFGRALGLARHDADTHLDLDVGAPDDDASGAVTSLRGSGTGFTGTGSSTVTLETFGYPTVTNAGSGRVVGR